MGAALPGSHLQRKRIRVYSQTTRMATKPLAKARGLRRKYGDHLLTALALVLALYMFVFAPLHAMGFFVFHGFITFALFGIIGAMVQIADRPTALYTMAIGLGANGAVLFLHLFYPPWPYNLYIMAAAWLGISIAFGEVVAEAVFRRGRVTYHRIIGAILLYLLIALAFATLYIFVGMLIPDAFKGITFADDWGVGSAAVYLSLVTLTSTGYGDIVAVHPIARSLCNIESIIGQLYPATLLARLVTLELSQSSLAEKTVAVPSNAPGSPATNSAARGGVTPSFVDGIRQLRRDHGDWLLTLLAGLLALYMFVFASLHSSGVFEFHGFTIVTLFAMIAAMLVISDHRVALAIMSVGVIANVAVLVLRLLYKPSVFNIVAMSGGWLAIAIALGAVVANAVFERGRVTYHRIIGAILLYLLIGLGFGTLFVFLGLSFPDAFKGISFADDSALASSVYYLSFVTLTSTGFGDIIPVHPLARSLCNMESVVGQLFPATLLARLVALELRDQGP
ncbi:ion channel [Bradyrhizobium jicamae]|nr:ion channel [Bradyrhizobium jicamae]